MFTNIRFGIQSIGLQKFIDKYLNKEMVIAELGCYMGDASEMFVKHVRFLYCVDQYKSFYAKELDLVSQSGDVEKAEEVWRSRMKIYPNCNLLKYSTNEAVKYFQDKSLDGVYIDAGHEYEFVKADIINYLPKIKDNGFIAGHDYGNTVSHFGVKKAVDELLGVPKEVFEDMSWIIMIKDIKK
jgi:hypothetical protein